MPQPQGLHYDPAFLGQPNKKVKEPPPSVFLGGDPEVFLKDKATGKIAPSCNKIGGNKGGGISISNEGYGITILEDNVAVEFNFKPCDNSYHFADVISHILHHGNIYAQKRGFELVPISSHKFTNEQLNTEKAQVFGCDPDFSAYDTEDKERIVDPQKLGNYRFCGGHIHLGFNNPHKIPLPAVAILLDMYIGLPSVQFDKQGPRRANYGLAGLYRPKPYGIEYRTMSNWWLRPEQQDWASRMSREAFMVMVGIEKNVDELMRVFDKMPLRDVQVALESENVKTCREVWLQARAYAQEAGISLGDYFPCLNKYE